MASLQLPPVGLMIDVFEELFGFYSVMRSAHTAKVHPVFLLNHLAR
jgi:hypothetical protein